ncbi:hypothetical protein GQ600_13949 [Phytophthora cactorum]|nr:hypothetical protein GQ600_13949 [Phytophthora cactorum]
MHDDMARNSSTRIFVMHQNAVCLLDHGCDRGFRARLRIVLLRFLPLMVGINLKVQTLCNLVEFRVVALKESLEHHIHNVFIALLQQLDLVRGIGYHTLDKDGQNQTHLARHHETESSNSSSLVFEQVGRPQDKGRVCTERDVRHEAENHVVGQRKQRRQRERHHEQVDKSVLDDHLVVVLECLVGLVRHKLRLLFDVVVTSLFLGARRFALSEELVAVFQVRDSHFRRVAHHNADNEQIVFIQTRTFGSALHEGNVEEGGEGIAELEQENLDDQVVFVLGVCAVVFQLIQLTRHIAVDRIEHQNLDGVNHSHTESQRRLILGAYVVVLQVVAVVDPVLQNEQTKESHDHDSNHKRHDQNGHEESTLALYLAFECHLFGVSDRMTPKRIQQTILALPQLGKQRRPQHDKHGEGDENVALLVGTRDGLTRFNINKRDDTRDCREDQHLCVELQPGKVQRDLLSEIVANLVQRLVQHGPVQSPRVPQVVQRLGVVESKHLTFQIPGRFQSICVNMTFYDAFCETDAILLTAGTSPRDDTLQKEQSTSTDRTAEQRSTSQSGPNGSPGRDGTCRPRQITRQPLPYVPIYQEPCVAPDGTRLHVTPAMGPSLVVNRVLPFLIPHLTLQRLELLLVQCRVKRFVADLQSVVGAICLDSQVVVVCLDGHNDLIRVAAQEHARGEATRELHAAGDGRGNELAEPRLGCGFRVANELLVFVIKQLLLRLETTLLALLAVVVARVHDDVTAALVQEAARRAQRALERVHYDLVGALAALLVLTHHEVHESA